MISLFMNNLIDFFDFASNTLSIFLGKPGRRQSTNECSPETADENSGFQQKNLENPVLTDMQKNLFEYWIRCSTSPNGR